MLNKYINQIICGDCLEVLKTMPDNSVDSIVTDPPYELGFMGKKWDSTGIAYSVEMWGEVLRVLKPGGHLLSFGGTRTYHRMTCAIEDAGFEIRDCIQWNYGSGFPKSMDISKQIDRVVPRVGMFKDFSQHYAEKRKESGLTHNQICEAGRFYAEHNHGGASTNWECGYNVPTLEQWKTLQPLLELSMEFLPLIERIEAEREIIRTSNVSIRPGFSGERYGKVSTKDYGYTAPATPEAQQWDGWGTALKPANEPIVLARKPISEKTIAENVLKWGTGGINIDGCRIPTDEDRARPIGPQNNANTYMKGWKGGHTESHPQGRFPANVILDEEAGRLLDEQSGVSKSSKGITTSSPTALGQGSGWNSHNNRPVEFVNYGDSGGASRFFYCAKASKAERAGSKHPTVKPLKLMRYLVRLITPPNGIVLDPFTGSGTTLEAATLEGFSFVGIEKQAEHIPDIKARIERGYEALKEEIEQAQMQQSLFA